MDKFYIHFWDGEKLVFVPIGHELKPRSVTLPGYEQYTFFAYTENRGAWTITEARTGQTVYDGSNMSLERTIAAAAARIRAVEKANHTTFEAILSKKLEQYGESPAKNT
jgi:hypothetical protein